MLKATLTFLFAFAAYFISRSPGLDDYDSVLFALGVRDFNLWKDQPHPPGYPLFIFLGWIGQKVFGVGPEDSLHFVAALGGALFVAAWFSSFECNSASDWPGGWRAVSSLRQSFG